MRVRSITAWVVLAIVVGGGALLVVSNRFTRKASATSSSHSGVSASKDDVPLATVDRGDVDIRVHATGELRASHTAMLTAPSVGGGSLQITHLLPTSSTVKKGDTVIEFDPSEQHYKLEQNRSELLQAEQEITKANADAAVLAAQDKVAALKAGFDVRQAELDVQKKEIVSQIDASKNELALQQAQRVQAELQKDSESHKQSGKAGIYLAQEKYNKAKLEMDQAQQNIDMMRVTASMDGIVSIQKNAPTDFFFTGMSVPDFHTGDQASPGTAIVQIVDPQGLEISAKLNEHASSNIKLGEPVEIVFDAMPGHTFHGKVKTIGGMSTPQFFDTSAGGTFEVIIDLLETAPALHAGFTAQLVFIGDTRKNVLYLPRQALFLKDGKRLVYVKQGSGYEQRAVKVASESETRSVVEGLDQGTQVALVDPTAARKPGSGGSASSITGTGTP